MSQGTEELTSPSLAPLAFPSPLRREGGHLLPALSSGKNLLMQRPDSLVPDQPDKEAKHLAWLQAEIDKGRASGVIERPAREVLAEIMARHRAKSENSIPK